ncbi:MAG: EsaB/YukD family protein [Oscillospiraceae bacterium]|nr:EsaB/YukD family protein [Oscillospiraceae bacterium]
MDYVLITLKFGEKTEDLKVPALVRVSELLEMFHEIYGISGETLHAEPKGMILDKSKTLEEQGVFHGARLTIN